MVTVNSATGKSQQSFSFYNKKKVENSTGQKNRYNLKKNYLSYEDVCTLNLQRKFFHEILASAH